MLLTQYACMWLGCVHLYQILTVVKHNLYLLVLSSCLEVIITEQMEKLTATLRGIRSLTSHAQSKASKLTQLIDQFESSEVSMSK